ncbi:uncharacterized protein TRUGW13939_09959 [Talaromyces rugulosus]|uniref:Uncharacterized protein n=1 Tax=Talaromyces rugulosus TaxID=121627 RepID=A0A7H8R8Q8_TALRU|nr:uncharacterized protein TRUGW13939_09959 [Talaromyces rugulosus]QKX62794.1 hypothetical protein TRUGW13939_09959 [Talaromyces rugulosus]
MDNCNSGLSRTADVPRGLQGKKNVLNYHLYSAVDEIMCHRGIKNEMRDGLIGYGFECLQVAIQEWVLGIDRDLIKQSRNFRRTFKEVFDREDLILLIRELGLGDETSDEADEAWMRWVCDLGTCTRIVLIRHIWQYLYKNIFAERYPIGVSEDSRSTFDDIFSVMKSGREDENTILLTNKLRSNIVTLLTKSETSQQRKKRRVGELSRGLAKSFPTRWIDIKTLEPHLNTLKINIIQNAVGLHECIACSSHEYLFMSPGSPDLVRGEIPDEPKLLSWDLKDTFTWLSSNRDIDGVLQCLYPGLYRRGMLGEENVLEARPVVLVYGHKGPKPPGGLNPQESKNIERKGILRVRREMKDTDDTLHRRK